jgi:LacI family transcriptional regulator
VPTLTTVHIPRDQIGRVICDCLMRSAGPSEQEFVVEPELVVRDSTGPAPR